MIPKTLHVRITLSAVGVVDSFGVFTSFEPIRLETNYEKAKTAKKMLLA
jgi:hypothetical protein